MSGASRVAVITGAAGGLGRIVTRHLAERGTRLALFGTHVDRLNELVRELNLPDDGVLTMAVDLGNADAVKAAAEAVIKKFGRVEILLHFVGGWAGGKLVTEVAASVVNDMLQQHLWTTFNVAQAFVPALVANG
ncbi:MAG: SDR family oxidoreductase [Chloroflexi bacterium]|nr:SDR family oxidoreductase [Chloroflexota bacterium]